MNLHDIIRTGAIALTTGATVLASAADSPLAAERWKTRPLVVFAASNDDPLLTRLHADLARQDLRVAFVEREMVLYTVVGDQARRDDSPLPTGAAASLRRAIGKSGSEAEAVLVGKDGGVKLRQTDRVDLATLFTTIDGMPMRRR